MPALGTQVTTLIHENLGVVVTFAFSRNALMALRKNKFEGEWKYVDRAIFEIPEQRAIRAVIELAVMFRSIDDEEEYTPFSGSSFGDVYDANGNITPLSVRELTNKLIHARSIEWDFSDPERPSIVCHAARNQAKFKWAKATIRIAGLVAVCGTLIS